MVLWAGCASCKGPFPGPSGSIHSSKPVSAISSSSAGSSSSSSSELDGNITTYKFRFFCIILETLGERQIDLRAIFGSTLPFLLQLSLWSFVKVLSVEVSWLQLWG